MGTNQLRYQKKLSNFVQLRPKTKSSFVPESQIPAEPDGEPIENLSKRHKADSKAKSTETAKAGDEVQPSHLWQSRIFWKYNFHRNHFSNFQNEVATHHIL